MARLTLAVTMVMSGCFLGDGRPGKAVPEETAGSGTSSSTTTETTASAECGNGIVEDGEACDDGNDVEGDGCNPDCVESGTVLWLDYYTGEAHGVDEITAVAVDADDNVLVVGTTWIGVNGGQDDTDIWIRKYSPAGDVMWTRTHAGEGGGADAAACVATDSLSNVAVGGYLITATGELQAWLAKHDSEGELLWTATETGLVLTSCNGSSDGGVTVTGFEPTGSPEDQSVWLARYDAAGDQLWTIQDGDPGLRESGEGVVVDESGGAFVVGNSNAAPTTGHKSVLVRSYDSDGERAWTMLVGDDEDISTESFASAIAVALDGSIVVAGYEYDWDESDTSTPRLWRLTTDGAVVWDGWPNGEDVLAMGLYDLAVDASGCILLVGEDREPDTVEEDRNLFVAKLTDEGTVVWENVHTGSANLYDSARGVATSPSGGLFVVGIETVVFEERDGLIARLAP